MKYAVIKTGGKQYRVSEGDTILIEKLPNKEKESVKFSEVLLYSSEDGNVQVGQPALASISVEAVVLTHLKGDKIEVRKYKQKVRYRRAAGHRQELTRVKIKKISDLNVKETPKKVETEVKSKGSTPKKKSTSTSKNK